MAAGFRAVSPVLAGVVPFGMIFGVAGVAKGLNVLETSGMSLLVFAGASQLAAIELMANHAPLAVAIATALVINLRMLMYSASLAPHLAESPVWFRALCGYMLTDQAYALSVSRFLDGRELDRKVWFYMGAALTLWIVWQIATLAGAILGAGIPAGWHLEFAIPLCFLSLIFPVLRDRPSMFAALVSGVMALVCRNAPLHSGMIIAAVSGIATGVILDRRAGAAGENKAEEKAA